MVKICYEFLNFSVINRTNRKINFKNSFLRYLPKGFFAFGILNARFESTFTKKLLNVSAMEVLFAIIFLSTNTEFRDVLVLYFSVTTDFVPS